MTYQAQESSVAGGWPLELYEFRLGPQAWRYTSGREPVVIDTHTYEPVFIRRSSVGQSEDLNRAEITIEVSRDNAVAALYLAQPPDGVVSVTIYRRHVTDSANELIVLWKGRVLGCRFTGSKAELSCEPVATSLRRPGLRARYSLMCRHALYSTGCGALKESHRLDGVVTAINGTVLHIPSAATLPDGALVAGMLATGSGARMIVGHVGSQVTLASVFPALGVGQPVRLYKGCNHTVADCRDKFNNLVNFGGFPFIPGKSPFTGDAIV